MCCAERKQKSFKVFSYAAHSTLMFTNPADLGSFKPDLSKEQQGQGSEKPVQFSVGSVLPPCCLKDLHTTSSLKKWDQWFQSVALKYFSI